MPTYKAIGLMTGSSLDGLDIAYCQLSESNGKWDYQFLQTDKHEYPKRWVLRLANLHLQNAVTYLKTSAYFGIYVGQIVKKYLNAHGISPDFIAFHGHTVFHQPDDHISSQVGDGSAVAAVCGYPVVSSFRSADVAVGGEGAPIAPYGDKHLFSEYRYCLNLGGIANISCQLNEPQNRQVESDMIGYDICPSNVVLNDLAGELGFEYDQNGQNGKEGSIDESLLKELDNLWYYDKEPPKSLNLGLVKKVIDPVLKKSDAMMHNKLRTYYEHIAHKIAESVQYLENKGWPKEKNGRMLATGGGALNDFLIERIREHCPVEVVVPDEQTVNYKEALLMAFLGALRIRREVNCIQSQTGAHQNTVNGALHYGVSGQAT